MVEAVLSRLASWIPTYEKCDRMIALCYHRVTDGTSGGDRFTISREKFVDQLQRIADSGKPVVDGWHAVTAEHAAILLTFDDNLPSHVEAALPELRRLSLPAVFYLNPAELGTGGQLTLTQLDELLDGGMCIGAHNNHHRVAVAYNAAAFKKQVKLCQKFLEGLNMPLTWAYPGGYIGSFNAIHEDILLDHGFTLRFSTLEGPCDPREVKRAQGRYVIRRGCTNRYFTSALAGGLQLMRLLKQVKGMKHTMIGGLPKSLD